MIILAAAIALLAASVPVRADAHVIAVGANNSLTFHPMSVAANPGDIITFSFQSGSHTATESTFASPCTTLDGGANSGPMPFSGGAPPPTYNYTVTDSEPVWFFCATGTHCQSGMVFAVNPTTEQKLAAFQVLDDGESNNQGAPAHKGAGASRRASIGVGAVAGALILGTLAAI